MTEWLYKGTSLQDTDIESHCGFVYIITNLVNGKKYIGKKIFKNKRRVKVKTKTRRKVKIFDSDWKDYYGSSPLLSVDIEHFGKSNFSREVLYLCKSKSEMAYLEAKEQFLRGCLETAEYYNEHIMVRVRKANLKYVPSL